MIVFVGKKLKLNGLAEVFRTRLEIEDIKFFEEESISIKNQENDILYACESNATYILYDTSNYLEDGRTIAQTIKNIYKTNKATPIILVPTDNPNNEIVKECMALQLKNFVNTALTLGEQKDQLEKIIIGYYKENERQDLKDTKEILEQEQADLQDYVENLYLASQREIERENTTVVVKKTNTEVLLNAFKEVIRVIFSIIAICLISIGLITLFYTSTRIAFLEVFNNIVGEISRFL